jgi:N utilization substance protein B
LNPTNSKVMLQKFWENFQESAAIREFAGELVEGVVDNREVIQKRIKSQSKNWSLSRMAKVDLNILRIGVFELLFRSDIPKNVTINEAIEVAKKFGTEDSPAFINGILDEIAASLPDKQ